MIYYQIIQLSKKTGLPVWRSSLNEERYNGTCEDFARAKLGQLNRTDFSPDTLRFIRASKVQNEVIAQPLMCHSGEIL